MKKENRKIQPEEKIQPEDYGQEQNAGFGKPASSAGHKKDNDATEDGNAEEALMDMIRRFNLTSDLFASKVFEDRKASGELCRILLGDDSVRVVDVRTKHTLASLERHSVELDILAQKKCSCTVRKQATENKR